jgi:fatty-acyl-CoA synthase
VVEGGELVSHDSGTTLPDGEVQVHGRADDVIISGGEKVAPAEIEQVLRRHPAVDDAAVVARACADFGRRPFAVVQTQQPLTTETLQRWCRQHLASFKVPDGFICLPALPRAELGKVALREVRSLLDDRFPQERPHSHDGR